MPLPKCQQCGQPLENTESINRGIGPDCLAKRSSFLAAAGASEDQLREWAASEDPTLAKWARKIVAACADGARAQRFVDIFVTAARKRAGELAQMLVPA